MTTQHGDLRPGPDQHPHRAGQVSQVKGTRPGYVAQGGAMQDRPAHEMTMKPAVSSSHWRFMGIGGQVPPLLGLSAGRLFREFTRNLTRMPAGVPEGSAKCAVSGLPVGDRGVESQMIQKGMSSSSIGSARNVFGLSFFPPTLAMRTEMTLWETFFSRFTSKRSMVSKRSTSFLKP